MQKQDFLHRDSIGYRLHMTYITKLDIAYDGNRLRQHCNILGNDINASDPIHRRSCSEYIKIY